MHLTTLLKDLPGMRYAADHACVDIQGICDDPELCKPGYLYLAAESETVDSAHLGERLDGRDYIDKAISQGAVAVLTTPGTVVDEHTIAIRHEEPLKLFGTLVARLYGGPYPKTIALVTGTDGKTSTVNFCQMFWSQLGHSSCSIGNLGAVCNDGTLLWDRDFVLSVPDTTTLHRILREAAGKGIDYVASECTSHALYDHRLTGVPASIGAFTNLTPEHLNFHKTMEAYFQVKMQLFEEVLPPGSWAILNADSEWYEPALEICKKRHHRIISFGTQGETLQLVKSTPNAQGQALDLNAQGKSFQVQLNLHALFQAYNVLCSLGIVMASGFPLEKAIACIPQLTEVEGRMNTVGVTPSGGRVVIDFAHTPEGIKAALTGCRSFTPGKLYILIGADSRHGNDKHQTIGKMASQYADQVIVTDSHPKFDDPALLRRDILANVPNAIEVAGRANAIELGCKLLQQGDTLLLAGMGHKTVLWIGHEFVPFSEKACVTEVLERMKKNDHR